MGARANLASLRFSLPTLLLAYSAAIGVGLYVAVSRSQDQRVEQDFLQTQLIRATELQSRTERAAERSELETARREFYEMGALEALRAAVFVAPDNQVLLTSRREWLNRPVDLAAFGLAPRDQRGVAEALAEARSSQQAQTRFTADRQGLVLMLPAALPRSRESLQVDRRALIVLVYDLSLSKAINRFHLRRQFALGASGLLLAAIGLGIGLHFFVTRRLEQVRVAIGRFAAGEAVAEAPSRLQDEIADIRSQFSDMARTIRREMAERQQAEAALRASELKFRSAMHFSPIGMALVSPEGHGLDVNPALCAILGYTVDELRNLSFVEITHTDDRPATRQMHARMLARELETFEIEKRYLHKDGHVVWAQLSTALVWSGGEPLYFVSQIQDITDRRRADAELHRVNRALRTISHCNQALVHATDERALLDELCRLIVTDGGYRLAWVGYVSADDRDAVVPVARAGVDDGYVDAIVARWSASGVELGDMRSSIRAGHRVVCKDYETDEHVGPWRQEALARGYRSSAVMPLKAGERPFGALLIYASEPNAFDEAELVMLGEMAEDLAYGIQALRMRERHLRAEQELRDSQSKLVIAMEMARLAPWEFDASTGEFVFNDTFYGLLRTTAEAEGGYTMSAAVYAQKFLPHEEQAIVQEEIDRSLASGDPRFTRGVEHRFLRADGSTGTMLVRYAVVADATGRVARTRGVSQDISERREREEALRISEERFRSAMSHSPVGMAIVLPDGRFAEVNSALCAIVGYTREELIRTRFQTLTHPDDLPRDLELVAQLVDRKVEAYQIEKRYLHKRGHEVWTQSSVSLVRDEQDRPRYFVKQVQDITERKRAAAGMEALNARYARHEAALATLTRSYVQSPGQFPEVLRAITEVVGRTLEVGRVSVWRPGAGFSSLACQDVYEWPSDRHTSGTVVTGPEVADYVHVLTAADIVVATDAAGDSRTAAFAAAHLSRHGVTSVIDIPIRERGALAAVLSCGHVGPRRKWTPDEQTFAVAVSNLLSSLFAQVSRQHLEEQLRQAQKLEGIGQLAGGVAHDFNNVLTVILGKAGRLSGDPRLPADLREAADDITQSGERAANLTRQLLAFSRRQAMQVREVDLNVVIRSVSRMLERVLGEDLTLRFSFAPEPALVCADPGMIDQVVLNLAINARDAMGRGGLLVVETALVELDAQAAGRGGHEPGPYACLRVTDTGSGITAENLPHIFEPFFTTKDVGKGTGLGLATTYGIVQQHGGWIDVESKPGRGATFRVFLPRLPQSRPAVESPAVSAPAAAAPAALRPPAGGESILVVEDEVEVRSLIVEALGGLGYHVLEAGSGPAALDVWRSHGSSIDLLITDMVMPDGMNGLELASEVKLGNPGLRVIYISGYLADVSQEDLRRSEGATYLAKPFGLPALARLVRLALDATDDRRTLRS